MRLSRPALEVLRKLDRDGACPTTTSTMGRYIAGAVAASLIDCAAAHGDVWETPGTPEHLLVEAAKLMRSLADAMEREKVDFDLVARKS